MNCRSDARTAGRGGAGRRVVALLMLAALLVTAAWGKAQAQELILDRVRVEGNQRVEAATVQSYMTLRPGDRITPSRIDRSLKTLFATGLFSDVTIRQSGGDLIVNVIENPIINRLAFEGNRIIDDEVLESEVQLRPRVVYTRSRVQTDVQRLVQIYRRSGRFAATVEPKVIQLPQNRVDLVFEINEGPVTGIRKINFIGNRAFSDRKLRAEITTKETRFWRLFSSADNYDPDRLTFDREMLRNFYLGKGYADFRVVAAVADLAVDRSEFFVTFTIDEGDRFDVGSITVESQIRSLPSSTLRAFIPIVPGEVYSATEVEETIQNLTFQIGNLGFAFSDIRPRLTLDRDQKLVDIHFDIDEGPRVYVERINITGNVRTLDKVIRREFRIAEGDAFNAARLRRSRQQVRDLGFFELVEMSSEPGSAEDKTVVGVDIRERSTGELTFGVGYSTTEKVIGDITIRERNLLGKGQDLRATFQLSARTQEIDLSFTEPYFLDRNLAAGFDVFRKSSDRQSESSFDTQEAGFALRGGYRLTENLRQNVRYTLRSDTISDIGSDASQFVSDQEGNSITSAVGHTLVYDLRDDRFQPTEGYIISFDQSLAGVGGNKRYLRNELRLAYYRPVWEEWVATLRLREGYVVGIGQDVGITDRFFVGGNNFRGFRPSGIGPRDRASGDALGGNMYFVSTAEIRFPLGLPSELGILGRVFSQAGTLSNIDATGNDLFDVGSIRISSGFGISWISPFGPIEVDYATVLKKEPVDETQAFFLSFGARF